jgi:Protein of unknown function (DUF2971)
MRVYHFVGRHFGLEDIRLRRLKIATVADLNDPFELLGAASADRILRQRFRIWRQQFDEAYGMLCFSRSWKNPVQWSHYADKHRGLCLGFEIPAKFLTKVHYSATRLKPDVGAIEGTDALKAHKAMLKLLTTKYIHWQYESEMRLFTRLDDKDHFTGLYYRPFSRSIRVKEVIIGACSNVTRDEVKNALGGLARTVSISNARLAFRTYTVTHQLNPAMRR